ncbi:MAG TPA: hypothetical protein VGC40_12830 [Paenirhodobacter sp.]
MSSKMKPALRRGTALFCLVAAGSSGTAVLSQQAGGAPLGRSSTITTQLGFEAGRNLDLDAGSDAKTLRMLGALGYSYALRTRQNELTLSAQINPQTEDGGDHGLYPTLGLGFAHQESRVKIGFQANYAEARVTDQSLGFDENTGAIVEFNGTGTRSVTRLNGGFEGGIDTPLGYSLQLNRSEIDYSDLSEGASYYNSTTDSAKISLRGDVSSMTSLNLDLGYKHYQAENPDQTDRTSTDASLGLVRRIDALTQLTGSIGRQKIRTERLDEEDENASGAIFSLGGQRMTPLGSYRASYDRIVTENGNRDQVLVGQDRETQFGKFSGTVGLSKGENGGTDWIGALTYSTELPRDELSAQMSRALRTSDDGDDVILTRISGNITHSLSDLNALDLELMASSTEYSDRDTMRIDATLAYQRRLTHDVNLRAGVKLGLATETDKDDANAQSLFMTVSRQFRFLN